MTLYEAMQWLEERGGRWAVRATSATCFVIATVGTLRVSVPAPSLTSENVDNAIVAAVDEIRASTERNAGARTRQ